MIHHSNTYIGKEELQAVNSVINRGLITAGDENRKFQREFSQYIGVEFVKLTNSGSMAFYLILKALDIQKGDEILLPDYICKDLLGPVYAMGATPMLYDNKENSWLSSDEEILSKVTPKTKIVVINHTFGFVFKDILSLSNRLPANVNIVEDCCHAIFGENNTLKEYTRNGSLCCFYSFNATKLLASGEGGAISSDDKGFISKLEKIKIGDNLSDVNCAISRIQLKRLDTFIDRRKYIAEIYSKEFKSMLSRDFFDNDGIYFRYPLLISENQPFWGNKAVSYRKGVDSLLSEHIKVEPMPNAKKVYERTVSIPIYPALNDKDVGEIVDETKKILQL
jgi:dTDP-4-amino-4,6-dideoxygalactose transaminase